MRWLVQADARRYAYAQCAPAMRVGVLSGNGMPVVEQHLPSVDPFVLVLIPGCTNGERHLLETGCLRCALQGIPGV